MAAGDLCQLADVKQWLGANEASGADALLTRLIAATSADFLGEIDRPDFFAKDWTETRRGIGLLQAIPRPVWRVRIDENLILRHFPINSITSLTLDGVVITASSDGLANGYWLDPNTDPEDKVSLRLIGYIFTRFSTATIVYNAGYTTAPTDIQQAVIEWVVARYRGRANAGGIAAIQMAEGRSQSESAHYIPFDMPQSTKRIVARYKQGAGALMFSAHD